MEFTHLWLALQKVSHAPVIKEETFLPYDEDKDEDVELLENLSPEVREQLRMYVYLICMLHNHSQLYIQPSG